MFGKQHDYAATAGLVVAILLGLIVIGGIAYTPAFVVGAHKRVLDVRQVFEEVFRH